MSPEQFQELKILLLRGIDENKDLIYKSHVSTRETDSNLHKEIRDDIADLKKDVKEIRGIVMNTPIVNKAVLSSIGLIVIASITGFVGFSWKFISSILKP